MSHLHARDLTLLLVSQAPLPKLQTYKKRMGWSIPWASFDSDFNYDLGASYTPEQEATWGLKRLLPDLDPPPRRVLKTR